MAPDFMKEMEWESFDMTTATEELFNNFSYHVGRFFLTHTKEELFREAERRNMTLYPVQTAADITSDNQLRERSFWQDFEHPELGKQLIYPRLPFILSEKFPVKNRRSPLIGEHDEEIYMGDLGLSKEEMTRLKELGVI